MPLKSRGLMIACLLFITACSSAKKKDMLEKNLDGEAMKEASRSEIPDNEVSSEDVEKNIERPYKSAYGEIALDQNAYVDTWINYFKGRGRPYMEQYLSRSGRYLPMMKNVLRENGLPEDLVYIALIESGFSPRAHSRANAVGYWQFIKGTGKRFGLTIDPFTDERRDPVLSTRAAAEYFKALYGLLGSWHLSMAAYNVGENRVKRAVTRYYTKDFWALLKKRRALPVETKNYVPKFIAAVMIAKDPKKYGFDNIEYQDPLSYDTVTLQSPISITKLASNINVDPEELRLLNPKFRTDYVPMTRGNETVVRIPVGRANDALAALSMSGTTQPKVLNAEYFYYRIRRGDTLSTIARKHKTTVSQIRRLNDLSNRVLLKVGRSIKVADPGGDGIQYVMDDDRAPSGQASSKDGPQPAVAYDNRDVEFHVVRRGENLTTIARRYNLDMSELLRLNNLGNRTMVRKGQKLRVKAAAEPKSAKLAKRQAIALASFKSKSAKAASVAKNIPSRKIAAASQSKRHTVKRGETLYDVSRKYGKSLSEIARANKVSINYRVMAGERLTIP